MNDRRTRLPDLILARLSLGAVPLDGLYWYDRKGRSWIDNSRERQSLEADSAAFRRPHYPDTD
ncbi:MAG TPA: hypothetical protein VE046_08450 [Steroidobacteraceae bacterium]|nr:hypothetical protein [Steroidobacteraceae bacterium]